jgi:hypothetical protein
VALVGGVERAAEQADPAARRKGQKREIGYQGRVCPLPRTTYLNVVS